MRLELRWRRGGGIGDIALSEGVTDRERAERGVEGGLKNMDAERQLELLAGRSVLVGGAIFQPNKDVRIAASEGSVCSVTEASGSEC